MTTTEQQLLKKSWITIKKVISCFTGAHLLKLHCLDCSKLKSGPPYVQNGACVILKSHIVHLLYCFSKTEKTSLIMLKKYTISMICFPTSKAMPYCQLYQSHCWNWSVSDNVIWHLIDLFQSRQKVKQFSHQKGLMSIKSI